MQKSFQLPLLGSVVLYVTRHENVITAEYNRQHSFAYSMFENETLPICEVLIGRHLIFHSLTFPLRCNLPRKRTPVKYKKRQKVGFPIVT